MNAPLCTVTLETKTFPAFSADLMNKFGFIGYYDQDPDLYFEGHWLALIVCE